MSFWEQIRELVKTYPLQTATVGIAAVAILVNVASTRKMVHALEVVKPKRRTK